MKHCIRTIWIAFSLALIAACGGGGESLSRTDSVTPDPDNQPSVDTLSISLSLVDSNGNTSNEVSDSSPLTLNATVTNQDKEPISNKVVTFVFEQTGLARFGNDTGTALTNSEGIASIQIFVDENSGSTNITASVDSSVTETIGFTSLGSQQEQATSIELFANSLLLPSSGNDIIELTAIVKNESNILMPNIPVSFSVNNNASLTVIDSETGDDGAARANLSTTNNPENREVTVQAVAPGITPVTLIVKVEGTEVTIDGESAIIIDDVTPITFKVADSDARGIPNAELQVSTNLGTISPADPVQGYVTDGQGFVTANFSSSESGSATISATTLNAAKNFEVTIQEDDFSFETLSNPQVSVNESSELTVRWFRNGAPFANAEVEFTSSRGQITVGGVQSNTAITDANGLAVISISSEFAGPTTISAIGLENDQAVASARTDFEFVAKIPHIVSVDATPDLIGPEGQQSTISAIVRDERGNLVTGADVDFIISVDDTGGSLSRSRNTTDSNGIASTVYTSNAVSSQNGVLIKAVSEGVEGEAYLTVGDRAFDISLGTGTVIGKPDNSTYLKEFAIFVTDAAGRPVANAELTASANPTDENAYRKGYWNWDGDNRVWVLFDTNVNSPTFGEQTFAACPSEDFIIKNNRLDPEEDRNGDGQLTPGNVAVVNFKDGISRTNEFGQATIEVRYPRQFAPWVTLEIIVSGASSGTEASESQLFTLGVAAEDLKDEAVSPPNSPFGVDFSNCFTTD